MKFDRLCAWMVCVCHDAQRCVAFALGWAGEPPFLAMKHIVDKHRKGNSFVRNSSKQVKRFAAAQRKAQGISDEDAKKVTTRRPKMDGETRWWSTHEMLYVNLLLKTAWRNFFTAFPREYMGYEFSTAEWTATSYLVALLGPMREFVRVLEMTKQCTLNLVIAFTLTLKAAYDEEAEYEIFDPDDPDNTDKFEYATAENMDRNGVSPTSGRRDFKDCQKIIRKQVTDRFFNAVGKQRNRAAEDVLVVAAFLDVSYRVSDFNTYFIDTSSIGQQRFDEYAPRALKTMMGLMYEKIEQNDPDFARVIAGLRPVSVVGVGGVPGPAAAEAAPANVLPGCCRGATVGAGPVRDGRAARDCCRCRIPSLPQPPPHELPGPAARGP
mmetsp:Transcript_31570/g.101322  ORF Transcript_31570/g.101322 Transcript_31570/m.101322 type:complete len:380 (+) Transcript_31570:1491-2630(+)